MKHLILALLLVTNLSYSQGILPGEPNPNTQPGDHNKDNTLVDDRKVCLDGTKQFQKMKCGTPGDENKAFPDCANFSVVLECRKKPQTLHCKPPKVPVPVYRCEG